MTMLPPLTGTPLDYVPIDTPIRKKRPVVFTAPTVRRAVNAAAAAAGFLSVFFFPSIGIGAIALAAMYGFVWAGNKLGNWLNEREALRATSTTSWWPDPFSWLATLLTLGVIIAILYFI